MPNFHEITAENADQLCTLYFEAPFGPVSLADAIEYTKKHRRINGGYSKGFFLDKQEIIDILNQQGVQGLKVYLGINRSDEKIVVAVGTDRYSNDISIPSRGTSNPTTSAILYSGRPCPDECGEDNVLNGE